VVQRLQLGLHRGNLCTNLNFFTHSRLQIQSLREIDEQTDGRTVRSVLRYITPCPEKKHPKHYRLSLKEMSTNYNNFWYKYFWNNWPSNDRKIYHLTQCLLLRYLGKNERMKYALK